MGLGVYPSSSKHNPTGPLVGFDRITRGGAFNSASSLCHVAARNNNYPPWHKDKSIGFRVALNGDNISAHKIIFHSNDGNNETRTQVMIKYRIDNLMPNVFERTGHTFAGWSTTPNGSVQHQSGLGYIIGDSDVNLYAVWTAIPYTVTFNANGGTGGLPSSVIATYGSPMPALINPPTKAGNTFAGYFDTSNQSGGTMYYDSNLTCVKNWDKANNTTLYARWTINSQYPIGSTGPAGGIVFYDKGNNSGGWRYLEAAPSYLEFQAPWGDPWYWYSMGIEGLGVIGLGVGDGFYNTEIILSYLDNVCSGGSWYAARICADYTTSNGFSDWHLPSLGELALMRQELYANNLGGFSNTLYWSSSEEGIFSAWGIDFSNGSQLESDQYEEYLVRPIRRF